MIVGHESGHLFMTPGEFHEFTSWLVSSRGWSVNAGDAYARAAGELPDGVLVFRASPEEQRRILDGEAPAIVLGVDV